MVKVKLAMTSDDDDHASFVSTMHVADPFMFNYEKTNGSIEIDPKLKRFSD